MTQLSIIVPIYNVDHPLAVFSALRLFLFFASLNFQNKLVNWCARSIVAAYLLQESPYFGYRVYYPFVGKLFANVEQLDCCGVFVTTIVFMIIAKSIDKLLKPLSSLVLRMYDSYYNY